MFLCLFCYPAAYSLQGAINVCVDHTDLLIAGSSHYVVSVSSQRSGSSVEVASVSSVTQVEQWRQARSARSDHFGNGSETNLDNCIF